ncbi:MAG TPA: PQQ-dependent sugar dehydrogenase [Gemmatimonadaceae bacterium]|nr:PQQ-dependent sugar dehydrogenase [Gemmatimonadaceae bacterium]
MIRRSYIVLLLAAAACGTERGDAATADQNVSTSQKAPAQRTAAEAGGSQAVVLSTQVVAEGLNQPVYVTAASGDQRLFIVEQPGRIRIVENGKLVDKPFLDIRSKVGCCDERGLLSVAFHPQYGTNGFLFVNYTDKKGDTRIERYTVSSTDRNSADPASAKLILTIDQPYANHNGGLNLFGPDGMLYIGMGDGGGQRDPHGNGQNRNVLLGKLLRINVDRVDPYSIPKGNPFASGGGKPEIWALGLRNPWRFSFDRTSGLLYIADVGQDRYEEINISPVTAAGVNYGWNTMDGSGCFRNSGCSTAGMQTPALVYEHSEGNCSIIGGFVYRGRKIPEIQGQYFYSDYCNSWVKSIAFANGRAGEPHQWMGRTLGSIVSFGEDAQGELYICSQNGRVYRIIKG